jgi:hypothetical protein
MLKLSGNCRPHEVHVEDRIAVNSSRARDGKWSNCSNLSACKLHHGNAEKVGFTLMASTKALPSDLIWERKGDTTIVLVLCLASHLKGNRKAKIPRAKVWCIMARARDNFPQVAVQNSFGN